jgi:hypothetical protein
MNRPTLSILIAAALLPGLVSADETTVYKSKDANGNTVYSQVETTGAKSQQVGGRDPAQPPAAETPKSEVQVACETAQKNLELLSSGQVLQRDKDKDGTPDDLTAEEIASEKDLAQRQVTAYCSPTPET